MALLPPFVRFYLLFLCFFVVTAQNGFLIKGITDSVLLGKAVSIGGDLNGDRFDDIILGPSLDYNGPGYPERSYVIYGNTTSFFPSEFTVGALSYSGFTISGNTNSNEASRVVAFGGDVNGDRYADIIIGVDTGKSYVIFGRNTSFSSIDMNNLNGSNGFTLSHSTGAATSVSIGGDINGDGLDDIVIGTGTPEIYVILGATTFSASFNLSTLKDPNGFIIKGIATDNTGYSVSFGGDVNGDKYDDILIGAPNADSSAGQSYVLFGRNSLFTSPFNLGALDGSNGFTIKAISSNDSSGFSVSIGGDVNGDKYDDILIGAPYNDANEVNDSGQSYVIFGTNASMPPLFDLYSLNGSNGFKINGIINGDNSGYSVSIAGDVNGDSLDDILIGAPNAISNGTYNKGGQSYLIFGTTKPFSASFNLDTLNGSNGFIINGNSNNRSGFSVSGGGDLNGDKFDDILIGAPSGSYDGGLYTIFGRGTFPAIIDLSNFTDVIQHLLHIQNVIVETEQYFNFKIQQDQFISLIGQPIDYSATVTSTLLLPSWLNFSTTATDLKFDGQTNQPGAFQITIVANNWNGTVTADFILNVVLKQRQFDIPLDQNQSFTFQVPDPSGGIFHFAAQQTTGAPLPAFIFFNPTTLVLSLNSTIEIQPQTVFVTILGIDDDGQEQVRYDYTLVFGSNSEAHLDSESDSVNLAAIVGGTVGGIVLVAFIVFVVVLVIFIWKRKTLAQKFSVSN